MRDQYGRSRLGTQHLPHPLHVLREPSQIKLDGSHGIACFLQALNDAAPTRAVHPGPVDQNHIGCTHVFPSFAFRKVRDPFRPFSVSSRTSIPCCSPFLYIVIGRLAVVSLNKEATYPKSISYT